MPRGIKTDEVTEEKIKGLLRAGYKRGYISKELGINPCVVDRIRSETDGLPEIMTKMPQRWKDEWDALHKYNCTKSCDTCLYQCCGDCEQCRYFDGDDCNQPGDICCECVDMSNWEKEKGE